MYRKATDQCALFYRRSSLSCTSQLLRYHRLILFTRSYFCGRSVPLSLLILFITQYTFGAGSIVSGWGRDIGASKARTGQSHKITCIQGLPGCCGFDIFETLSVNTPLKSPANISQSSHKWFSQSIPNADVDYLQKLTVLSDVTLKALVGQLPDTMSNGAHSIIHSWDSQKNCLPLWMLRYWEKISDLITCKAKWKLATTWATQSMTHRLSQGIENGDCIDQASEEVDNILHLLPHQQNPLCSGETVYSRGSRGSREMDLLPESSRGLWRSRPSSGGSRETDLPPEAPEKQTFLWSLQRTFSKPCFPLWVLQGALEESLLLQSLTWGQVYNNLGFSGAL